MYDPIDAVNALGWRVVWVNELGHTLLFLDERRIVLADADLTCCEVARMTLRELSPQSRGESSRDAQPW